jgi:1-acyl-sn-glycerol-3-phosphate acyltransferase
MIAPRSSTNAFPTVPETRLARWSRRASTISLYFLALLLVLPLLPLLLAAAVAVDLVQRRHCIALRCLAGAIVYLVCECLGLVAAGITLVISSFPGVSRERHLEWTFALQRAWARALFVALRMLFRLRFEIYGEDALAGRRPLLVFIRHTSLADTLLPAELLTRRHGIRLRYVLKRELLWDPCMDVVGQRLPNVFVRRASGRGEDEIAAVRALARDAAADEGILIYPEGTRFTAAKRDRACDRLARTDPERGRRARSLRHVLPPRYGGPLALLDARPDADVIFLAHAGFDGAASFASIWSGDLVGKTIHVRFWRVAAEQIPADPRARGEWLDAEWAKLDLWIEHLAQTASHPGVAVVLETKGSVPLRS